MKGGGQRVSRHYYDVYRLLASETGLKATGDAATAEDCVRHARMFFNRPDLDLASAVPGSFSLTPHDGMLADLRRDYEAMSGMVFGSIPNVDEVVAAVSELEHPTTGSNTRQESIRMRILASQQSLDAGMNGSSRESSGYVQHEPVPLAGLQL